MNEWYSLTSWVGYAVLLLVGVLTSIVVLAFFFVTPRRSKVIVVFLACIVSIGVVATVFMYLLGIFFSLIVP